MKIINSNKVKHDALIKQFADILKEELLNNIVGSSKPSWPKEPKSNTVTFLYYPTMPLNWIQMDFVLERKDK